jgi:chromatin remodeling complex protein RSC6
MAKCSSKFTTPTLISDSMCLFLEKENGLKMKRTDVTRLINVYIRDNKLQDINSNSKINPDSRLQTLFQLNQNDELTYFNIQKYMSPHFANMNMNSTNIFTESE